MESEHTVAPATAEVTTSSVPTVKTLVQGAWSLYKKKIKSVVPFALIGGVATWMLDTGFLPGQNSELLILTLAGVLAVMVGVYIMLLSSLSIFLVIITDSKEISVLNTYKIAQSKIISYLWITILASLITICGLFLFIIPGIVVGLWFSFIMYAFLIENDKGMSALLKSKEYVRGKELLIFGHTILLAFIGTIISGIAGIAVMWLPKTIEIGANNIISFLVAPFLAAYMFLLYTGLRTMTTDIQPQTQVTWRKVFTAMAIFGVIACTAISMLLLSLSSV